MGLEFRNDKADLVGYETSARATVQAFQNQQDWTVGKPLLDGLDVLFRDCGRGWHVCQDHKEETGLARERTFKEPILVRDVKWQCPFDPGHVYVDGSAQHAAGGSFRRAPYQLNLLWPI